MASSIRLVLLISLAALAGGSLASSAATPPPATSSAKPATPKAAPKPAPKSGAASESMEMAAGVSPEADALLTGVGVAYADCKSYQFEGASRMTMSAKEQHQTFDVPFRLAAIKPTKVRSEILNPSMSYVTVSDGSETWAYVPQAGQYTRTSATPLGEANSTNQQLGVLLASGTPIQRYLSPKDGLLAARVLGESRVKANGASVKCRIVQAQYAAPENSQVKMSPNTLWIDPTTHLVMRDSLQMRMVGPNDTPVRLNAVTTFRVARVNQAVPDSVFTFTPPAGAKLVEKIDMPGMSEPASPLVGKPAEEISLADITGKPRRLSELKGRVVLLDFWATWCGPCRREMPTIVKLHQELTGQGLSVVAVNVGEEPGVVKAFLTKNNYSLPVWLDVEREAASVYGASAIPTLVVIDREGKVIEHKAGMRDEAALRAMLKKAGL